MLISHDDAFDNDVSAGCDSNPCLNDGFCMDGSDGMFTCVCSPSYTGDFCQTEGRSPFLVLPDGLVHPD